MNGENGSAKANQAANGPSATGDAENEDDDSDKEDENGAPDAGATGGRTFARISDLLVRADGLMVIL